MKQHVLLAALAAGMSLLLAACGGGSQEPLSHEQQYAERCALADAQKDARRLPVPTGEHCLGRAHYALRDMQRLQPTGGDGPRHREVGVTVWYPATQWVGGAAAEYLAPEIAQILAANLEGLEAAVFDVRTYSRQEVPMASGRHPVMLFSPGVGSLSALYTSLAEDMASHGYVVVAVDHPYVSGPVRLLDGSLAVNDEVDPELLFTSSHVVVDDLRFVLDWLAVRNADTAHLLGGKLDLAHVGAYGHSYGGSAALQWARSDARVLAGVNLDGSVFGDLSGSWDFPFLLLQAEHPPSEGPDPTIEAVWGARGSAAERMELAGMAHNSFTDTKYLLSQHKGVLTQELAAALDLGQGDAAAELSRVRQLTREFLGRYLR